jgi:hypothetical protein
MGTLTELGVKSAKKGDAWGRAHACRPAKRKKIVASALSDEGRPAGHGAWAIS